MKALLLISPVLLPLLTLVACILLRRQGAWVIRASLLGSVLLLGCAGVLLWQAAQGQVLSAQMGGWQAPYGISLVIDRLAAALIAISALIGLATLLYGLTHHGHGRLERHFHLFVHGLMAGICGAFITADLFNLYVWFEVLLIASFALISLGGGPRRLAGSLTYVALNLLATLVFLLAAGLLYGSAGTLNMGELAVQFRSGQASAGAELAVLLMLLAFAIKAALFPVFGWLPATYHVAWTPISALFAGLLTKVGVYALIRLVTLLWPEPGALHQVLLWLACATMLVGVLGAAAQTEVRRILSFHVVSQVGYMVLGLALASPLALAGAVFFSVGLTWVMWYLFFIGGLAALLCGSERLAAMGGLYARAPWLALLFAIPALSLAGIPPLSGFWAKFLLVKASLDLAAWTAAAVALLTGVFTLLSMSKIWNEAFLKPHPDGEAALGNSAGLRLALAGIAVLAGLTLLIGLAAGPVLDYAQASASQLLSGEAHLALLAPPAGD